MYTQHTPRPTFKTRSIPSFSFAPSPASFMTPFSGIVWRSRRAQSWSCRRCWERRVYSSSSSAPPPSCFSCVQWFLKYVKFAKLTLREDSEQLIYACTCLRAGVEMLAAHVRCIPNRENNCNQIFLPLCLIQRYLAVRQVAFIPSNDNRGIRREISL